MTEPLDSRLSVPAPGSHPGNHPGRRERFVRQLFKWCMKDKHLKALARRHWPVMPVVVEGHRFELHPADNTTEFRLFMDRSLDERDSLQALIALVRERRCLILDIGANCGAYAVPLASEAGAGSRLHAFEPSPLMAARLERNLHINALDGKASVHRVALSSERGETTLNVHPKNHGQSSLRTLDGAVGGVRVEQRLLADFVEDPAAFERFVVKIDVEGREADVLCPYLASCPDEGLPDALLIEMVLEGSWGQDLRALLERRGYTVTLEADGNALFVRDRQ